MKILLAESAGFCFGVKRALETVENERSKSKDPVYTWGPIIHNEIVVNDLESRGVYALNSPEDLKTSKPGTIVIRSHGVSEETYNYLKKSGFEIVDATCPFVLKIHNLVREYSKKGYYIIITGNPDHPEVRGITGWIDGNEFSVISNEDDAMNFSFSHNKKIFIVSQTTFEYAKFDKLVEIIREKGYDTTCVNTICSATEERQKEAADIAGKVDVMIVTGGKHSSNSQKLYRICKEINPHTFFIQSSEDLDLAVLKSIDSVGITAGASTPQKIIEEVLETCQNKTTRALKRC